MCANESIAMSGNNQYIPNCVMFEKKTFSKIVGAMCK